MRTGLVAILLLLTLCVACGRGDVEPQQQPPPMIPVPSPTLAEAAPAPTPPSSQFRLVVENAQGSAGEVVPVEIALYNVAEGVSGYSIRVSSASPQIARIMNVRLPEYGLTKIGEVPAPSVEITAVDLPGLLEGAFDRETIATIDVELLSPGETELLLELRRLDDDKGNILDPEIVKGSLLVN